MSEISIPYHQNFMPRIVSCIAIWAICLSILSGCASEPTTQPNSPRPNSTNGATRPTVAVPNFNADSAFAYVKRQVDFGPRVPGTPAHKACADWLTAQLRQYSDTVLVQTGKVTAHNGKKLPMYNIIASFAPQNPKRILLAAHWDTRPVADQDDERSEEPILGANDGGSGVGVLLEIARQLHAQQPQVGIDIVLFDVEDYGSSDTENSYCLGSQYWAAQPHRPGYKAQYGILLDMVGAADAVFPKEQFSLAFAPDIVQRVWNTATNLGFDSYFTPNVGGAITDDHFYVNKLANIPTIDIIHYTPEGTFGKYWHTHDDNMSAVDKNTLSAVGTVVLHVIYNEAVELQ